MKRFLLRGFAAFVLANVLIIYFPGSASGVLTLLILSGLLMFVRHENGLLVVFTCLFCTLALEGAVRLSGDRLVSPYYRPHEMVMTETRFQSNRSIEMESPHGDLLAIDPLLDRRLASPRFLRFSTDSLGYRNSADYMGEPLVLVGDSFVVGTGNSQADTLSEVLRNQHGLPAYNLAFPNGPLGYARMTLEAKEQFGTDACYAVVFFEGNDFQLIEPSELALRQMAPSRLRSFTKAYVQAIKAPFEISRVFFGLYTKGFQIVKQSLDGADRETAARELVTFVESVSGFSMAFLNGYADVVRRESYDDHGFLSAQLERSRPDLLVFVPDKYRVYAPLLDEPIGSLPNAQLDFLQRVAGEHDLPVVDTTRRLIERSRELLDENRLTYWPDDTHWRREGIEVAASLLTETLRNDPPPRCAHIAGLAR